MASSSSVATPVAIWPVRMTTGPDGRFFFPGTPAAIFHLRATDPLTSLRGTATGVLPEGVAAERTFA